MLYLFSLRVAFINFMQSGMYIDYVVKQLTEMFVRNVFVYSALFFGEKFVIEFLSKKWIDNITNYFNTNFINKQYDHSNLYHNLVVFLLSVLVAVEYWFLFIF